MDMISTKILKTSSPSPSSPLKYFYNTALSKGIVPDRLKFSLIQPLYKNGSKLDTTIYIPISLWAAVSKILEKAMQTRSSNNWTKFNIIRKEQYGYRTKLTTEYARYSLTNKILNAFNNKLMVRGIFWLRVGSQCKLWYPPV
jgi:hypothetical protein